MITLFPTYLLGDLRLTSYPYAVEFGGDHGAPETITELVQSLLADGDIVRVTRHGNREISLVVHVEGSSLAEVAENEAALRRECAKVGNLLTFEPGDPLGSPASVFEVLVAEMRHPRDDEAEQQLLRRWEVTLTCAPFARSADKVVVPALDIPVSASSVVIDTCDSATGWSADINGTPATVDMAWSPGAVSVHELLDPAPQYLGLSRTGSVDFSSHRYLVIEVGYNAAFGAVPVAAQGVFGGTARELPRLSQKMMSTGWYEVIFDTAGSTFSTLNFFSYFDRPYADLKIREVRRTNSPPSQTNRQLSRIIEAGGTERTPATIHVASRDPAVGLGTTLVHTCPEDGSGYSPPLRRWRVSGNAVDPASDTFSGSYEPIHGASVVFEVPNSAVPEGEYALCVALKTDTVGTHIINWSAQTRLASSSSGTAPFEGSTPVQFFTTTDWHFVSLTPLSLPTMRGNDGAFVRIALEFLGAQPPTILYDDAWIFRVGDDCALTVVNSVPQHLWLDSPGISSNSPEVSMSTQADRLDEWHPGVSLFGMGTHYLSPEGTTLFTASRDIDYPEATAEFFCRWHSNAAS